MANYNGRQVGVDPLNGPCSRDIEVQAVVYDVRHTGLLHSAIRLPRNVEWPSYKMVAHLRACSGEGRQLHPHCPRR